METKETIDSLNTKIAANEKSTYQFESELEEIAIKYVCAQAAAVITNREQVRVGCLFPVTEGDNAEDEDGSERISEDEDGSERILEDEDGFESIAEDEGGSESISEDGRKNAQSSRSPRPSASRTPRSVQSCATSMAGEDRRRSRGNIFTISRIIYE